MYSYSLQRLIVVFIKHFGTELVVAEEMMAIADWQCKASDIMGNESGRVENGGSDGVLQGHGGRKGIRPNLHLILLLRIHFSGVFNNIAHWISQIHFQKKDQNVQIATLTPFKWLNQHKDLITDSSA